MTRYNTTPHGLPFIERARIRARQQQGQRYAVLQKRYAPPVQVRTHLPSELSSVVHSCPLSNLPFSGQCPVYACPGNKPGLEDGGCLYLFYGRTRLDKADIMFSYKLNEKRLHDSIAQGQERVVQAVGFYKTLNDVRNRNTMGMCPHCGVGHKAGVYTCDNAALCEDRRVFADLFIQTSNLAFAEIQGQKSDVYLIARELHRFQKVSEATQTNMCELLGIGPDQLKALSTATAYV